MNAPGPISLPLAAAAASVGLGERYLRDAMDSGDLIGHWAGSKRLFLIEDLREWVEAMPTSRPEKKPS
ncbi:hypothetical protein [Knoellia sp. LjRoot47]|uniref:hypothetical protein n=1 Tax=Knoellia sp. LjRoot47 TaxID=3342330 RepID=UPI003ECD7D5B